MTTATANPNTGSAQVIVHFVRSIEEVLTTMTSVSVTIGKPIINSTEPLFCDVSGIIGFSGTFVGSMVLGFDNTTACNIVEAFAGARIEADSPDFPDAVGELANMIAGAAKKAFEGENSISVPCVVAGKGHTVARLQGAVCVTIPCETRLGNFFLEICLKRASETPHSVRRNS